MSTFLQDLRYGFRMLRKNPGFTVVALVALALGIGANTALFSVVYGVLLKPLPYAQGKELVVLHQEFPKANVMDVGFSVKELNDYREQAKSLAQIEEYHQMSFILLDGQEPDEVRTGVVSAHFFDLLGIKPYLGRFFTSADDVQGADAVLILSYTYWQTRYGGDRSIIGRHFRMNDKVHTVVGVLPPVPQYPRENDVYMPTVACPYRSSPTTISNRGARGFVALGRLRPGADLTSGNADLNVVAARLQQANPADYPVSRGLSAAMDGLQNQLTKQVRPMLLVLLATGALARIMRREQEMAVRAALGANRGRLIRQLLTESTLLSVAGGALGLLLACGCLELLVRFVGRFTTRAAEVRISTEVLLFTLAISILTGLIFGSIPALAQRLNLVTSLKEGSANATVKASGVRLRNVLVAGQVALSFVLLIGAGLMVRSFIKLQQVNAGYNPENVLTANVPLNFSKYNNQATLTFFDRVMRKLEATPGILAVGVNNGAPLAPGMPMNTTFIVEGRVVNERQALPSTDVNFVSPGGMQLLGIPLISGRFFTPHDNADSPEVAIISRSLARHSFPNEDPLGKRISADNGKSWVKIVGVVGDVKYYDLDQETKDTAYVAFAQSPMGGTLLVKTAGNPINYAQQVRDAVYSVDPEQPVNGIKTLGELRGDALVQSRLTALLLALFAALALAIAATGLSGVTALMVSQRTREIGIRMALGAQSNEMLRMVLMQGMSVIAIGLAVGAVAALLFSRVMKTLLFETTVTDPATFIGVSLMFLAVGFAASYVPARRVTKVDPLIALRSE